MEDFIKNAPALATAIATVVGAILSALTAFIMWYRKYQADIQQIKELVGKGFTTDAISNFVRLKETEVSKIVAKLKK